MIFHTLLRIDRISRKRIKRKKKYHNYRTKALTIREKVKYFLGVEDKLIVHFRMTRIHSGKAEDEKKEAERADIPSHGLPE